MEESAAKIQEEISGLQSERAVILAQLEKIELALTKAQATKVIPPTPTPPPLSFLQALRDPSWQEVAVCICPCSLEASILASL